MTPTSTRYAESTTRVDRADYATREIERLDREDSTFNPWDDTTWRPTRLEDGYDDVDASYDEDLYDLDADEDDDEDGYAEGERWRSTSRRSARRTSRHTARAQQLDDEDEPKRLRRRWKTIAILAIACAGILGVVTQALQSSSAAPNAGALNYHWQRGYYLDNGWLCYGWSSGAYHCTVHWHKSGSTLVSDNPSWVPNISGASQPSVTTASAPKTTNTVSNQSFATHGEFCTSSVHFVANISQWTVPPGCYANIYYPNPANYVYRSGFGWCNWWPEVLHPGQPDLLWGGEYKRTSVPAVGAAVFFSGGVQGASSAGHYAEVVAISSDHYWVLVSEMNFYWRGGGWQHVDYRYIHVGAGVTFIYP